MDVSHESPSSMDEYFPDELRSKYDIASAPLHQNGSVNVSLVDIDWSPDAEKYKKRRDKHALNDSQLTTIPHGWPHEMVGPLAWTGRQFDEAKYVIQLSDKHISELESALDTVAGKGIDEVEKHDFLLPTFELVLENLKSSLYDGSGFFVLRGLDPQKYSPEENARIYLGIAKHIAPKNGRQNLGGAKILRITDMPSESEVKRRPIYSNDAMPFHADVICGVLGLYYLNTAKSGGDLILASSWKIYNELAKQDPHLLKVLAEDDWPFDTLGYNPPFYHRAILHFWKGRPILNFSRRLLTGSPATPRTLGIPSLTDDQANALDAVQFIAAENGLKIHVLPGDMVFVNNLAILHSRDHFQDTMEAKRAALRLWLHDPEKGWEIPPGLRLAWARIFEAFEKIPDQWDLDAPKPGSGGSGGSGGTGGGKGTDCG